MRLPLSFYRRPVLDVAPELIGKILVRRLPTGEILKLRITETEAYNGEEDTACHARAGRTERTKVLYQAGGCTYVYLCYGIHYLLNVVTGPKDHPEAALIRGVERYPGPGKLTKALEITKALHNIDLATSPDLWIEDDGTQLAYTTTPRIGINYATDYYRTIPWRFVAES
jgi:DNA-3-methyladenine glycosylase